MVLINFLTCTITILITICTAANLDWGYQGQKSPEHWTEVAPTCKGNRQSPIALNKGEGIIKFNGKLVGDGWKNSWDTALKIINNGHSIQVDLTPFNLHFVGLNCTKYQLKQYHIHSPSEHTINGKRYDVEAHFVFSNDKGDQNQVFGILFQKTKFPFKTSNLFDIEPKVFEKLSVENSTTTLDKMNLKDLVKDVNYFRSAWSYLGSLTTPPCTENVHWTVATKVLKISYNQYQLLQKVLKEENNRPIQKTTPYHKLGIHYDNCINTE